MEVGSERASSLDMAVSACDVRHCSSHCKGTPLMLENGVAELLS